MLHSGVNGIFAGHKSASGWCADRCDIISIEQQSGVRQNIDIRSWDLTGTVKADIIPPLIRIRINLNATSFSLDRILKYDSFQFCINVLRYIL